MNNLITKLMLVCFILFVSCSAKELPVPRPAPYTKFVKLNGQQVSLSSFKGKTLVVIFWAKWCKGSVKLIKELDSSVKNTSEKEYIAVNLDKHEKSQEVIDFIKYQTGNNLTHMFSGNAEYDEAYYSLGGRNLPHILVIDPSGTIIRSGHGKGVL